MREGGDGDQDNRDGRHDEASISQRITHAFQAFSLIYNLHLFLAMVTILYINRVPFKSVLFNPNIRGEFHESYQVLE